MQVRDIDPWRFKQVSSWSERPGVVACHVSASWPWGSGDPDAVSRARKGSVSRRDSCLTASEQKRGRGHGDGLARGETLGPSGNMERERHLQTQDNCISQEIPLVYPSYEILGPSERGIGGGGDKMGPSGKTVSVFEAPQDETLGPSGKIGGNQLKTQDNCISQDMGIPLVYPSYETLGPSGKIGGNQLKTQENARRGRGREMPKIVSPRGRGDVVSLQPARGHGDGLFREEILGPSGDAILLKGNVSSPRGRGDVFSLQPATSRASDEGSRVLLHHLALNTSAAPQVAPMVPACPTPEGHEPEGNSGSKAEQGWPLPFLPPPPVVPRPRASYNAAMLAYMGDSIYETYARWHFLSPPVAIPAYCKRVTAVVCCEAQDLLLRKAHKAGFFTEQELDVLRWGRNASTGQRRAKGRAGTSVYANATALETLIAYLYLTQAQRLHSLMAQLGFTGNSSQLLVPSSMYSKTKNTD